VSLQQEKVTARPAAAGLSHRELLKIIGSFSDIVINWIGDNQKY